MSRVGNDMSAFAKDVKTVSTLFLQSVNSAVHAKEMRSGYEGVHNYEGVP